jgi:putative tryptophan/tyrosine transport system substrate-binding protein
MRWKRSVRELRDLGWVEGQNIVVEYRWAEGQFDRLPGLVEELVRLKVDLIVAPTSIYTGAPSARLRRSPLSSPATRTRSAAAT